MDTLELDGETWSICEMTGSSAVPTSRALGFRTTMEHTANWRGRVDHFGLDAERRLVLLEVRATLANPERARGFVPLGATRIDEDERTVRFRFEHRLVPLTGRVVAGADFDESLYVHMGTQTANRSVSEPSSNSSTASWWARGSRRGAAPTRSCRRGSSMRCCSGSGWRSWSGSCSVARWCACCKRS